MTYSRETRRLGSIAGLTWMAAAGLMFRACVTSARGDPLGAPATPDFDIAGNAGWLMDEVQGMHAGAWAAIAGVYVVVKALRAGAGERFPVLRSPAGGATLAALVSLLGALLTLGASGRPWSWNLIPAAILMCISAAGAQSIGKDIAALDFKPKEEAKPVVGNPP